MPSTNPLLETRLAGDRKRELWFQEIAEKAAKAKWSKDRSGEEVRKAAEKAIFALHLKSEASFKNAICEASLATHENVRDHVPRLISIRDEVWRREPDFMRQTKLHGASQTFVDLMRRQKRQGEQVHTATADAYLAYLRKRFS